jgi:hypothetical protein
LRQVINTVVRSVSISFVLIGKLTASSCQLLIIIYTTETYPTALRSTGVGLSACIARLVAMIVPQLSATQYSVWLPLPYIVYSISALLAAFAASQLPPMHKPCKLPETIHEVEKQQTPRPSVVSSSPATTIILDQRRPSSALIRELGVPKPSPVPPYIGISRGFPRRHSAATRITLSTNSQLPTITDVNEDKVCSSHVFYFLLESVLVIYI